MSTVTTCLGRFVWHDLMTVDAEKATAFYTALFPEWNIKEIEMENGSLYRMIHVGEHDLGGIVQLVDAPPEVTSHWIGYVAVDDCDATVAKVQSLGGACPMPAEAIPNIGRLAVVTDGQGAALKPVELIHPLTPPEKPLPGMFCWDELITNDLDSAKRLYCEAFGWQTGAMHLGEAGVYTLFKLEGKEVAGAMNLPKKCEAKPSWTTYLAVDDVDARSQKAEQLGAKIHLAPREIPGVGRFCVLVDPTEGVFALFSPSSS